MEEIWKDIDGFEGLYEVSNLGRVKRLDGYYCCGWRNCQKRHVEECIMSSGLNHKGYPFLRLSKNGKRGSYLIHRLMMEAFVPNPLNLPQVNHKDENKTNNFIFVNPDGSVDLEKSNLEWCDNKYNCNYGSHKENISKSNKGKKISEETRKKLSEAKKGDKNPMWRHVFTEEELEKHRGHTPWNKGKHWSEEVKEKMRQSALRRYSIVK